MEQIDCLSSVTWEAENNLSQDCLLSLVWDELASKSTTIYCRKALQNLTSMIDDLYYQISNARKGRKKIAALKVLLKKDLLKRLEKRLENAVRMLTLAQQSHLVALMRVQPNIIVERFTTLTTRLSQTQIQPSSECPSDDTKDEHAVSNEHQECPKISSIAARPLRGFSRFTDPVKPSPSNRVVVFQLPKWLSRRAWEFYSIKSYGAWQYYLRSYSTIPPDSEILRLTIQGSPNDMQKLFDAKLASPYDRDHNGRTLLHWATCSCNFRVVRYLVTDVGLNIAEKDDVGSYPMDYAIIYKKCTEDLTDTILSDETLTRNLFVYPRLNDLDEDIEITPELCLECNCRQGYQDLELYKALLPIQCPSHKSTSLKSRLRTVDLFLCMPECSIDVVQLALELQWYTDPQSIYTSASGIISLTSIASRICHSYFLQDLQNWLSFIVDIVRHTPKLSEFYEFNHWKSKSFSYQKTKSTALIILIICLLWNPTSVYLKYRHFCKIFPKVLVSWLEVLEQAGIDLVEYGRCEYELFIRYAERCFDVSESYLSDRRELPFSHIYLVGFKFNEKPTDWEFYWDEPTDEFAGDFWELVEDRPLRIPGSWVD
ncbi:hypothetical protein F5B19DRAFT_82152 [Rostrohypoxylon terebratum]|nr:hypothetical protein F5B19DRAFT_82152 [Rostrohypoxylon terebratum]